jgi:hypothetical protein
MKGSTAGYPLDIYHRPVGLGPCRFESSYDRKFCLVERPQDPLLKYLLRAGEVPNANELKCAPLWYYIRGPADCEVGRKPGNLEDLRRGAKPRFDICPMIRHYARCGLQLAWHLIQAKPGHASRPHYPPRVAALMYRESYNGSPLSSFSANSSTFLCTKAQDQYRSFQKVMP